MRPEHLATSPFGYRILLDCAIASLASSFWDCRGAGHVGCLAICAGNACQRSAAPPCKLVDCDVLVTLGELTSGRYKVRVGIVWPDAVGSVAEVFVAKRIDDRSIKPGPVCQWTLEDEFSPDSMNAQVSSGGPIHGECE